MAEYLLVGGLDRLASNRARDERPHLDALFAVLRGEIDYVASKYGADFPAEYAARWEIAEILTEQLARKLPGLHSVTITLFDKNGEPSIGIKGYSEKGAEVEARDRDLPQAIVSGPGPFRKAIADAIKAYNDRLGDENAPTDLGALRDTRNERQ
jgi:hypothetical protein